LLLDRAALVAGRAARPTTARQSASGSGTRTLGAAAERPVPRDATVLARGITRRRSAPDPAGFGGRGIRRRISRRTAVARAADAHEAEQQATEHLTVESNGRAAASPPLPLPNLRYSRPASKTGGIESAGQLASRDSLTLSTRSRAGVRSWCGEGRRGHGGCRADAPRSGPRVRDDERG